MNIARLALLSYTPPEKRPSFDLVYWLQFFLLSFFGGALALAYDLSQPISALAAFNVGLSIPAILKALASEFQANAKHVG